MALGWVAAAAAAVGEALFSMLWRHRDVKFTTQFQPNGDPLHVGLYAAKRVTTPPCRELLWTTANVRHAKTMQDARLTFGWLLS